MLTHICLRKFNQNSPTLTFSHCNSVSRSQRWKERCKIESTHSGNASVSSGHCASKDDAAHLLAIVTLRQPQLLHQRHIFRRQQLLGAVINPAHDLKMVYLACHGHRRFLIQPRAAARQYLFQQRAPLDAAAPFSGTWLSYTYQPFSPCSVAWRVACSA